MSQTGQDKTGKLIPSRFIEKAGDGRLWRAMAGECVNTKTSPLKALENNESLSLQVC